MPGGTRAIKVIEANGAAIPIDLEFPSGVPYLSSDETVATVSDTGVITALQAGRVTISVIRLGSEPSSGALLQAMGQSEPAPARHGRQRTMANPCFQTVNVLASFSRSLYPKYAAIENWHLQINKISRILSSCRCA